MAALVVRPLSPDTWADFARLVESHGGVWGGCWCLEFHAEGAERGAHRREAKHDRVRNGTAHAALVYDGDHRGQGVASVALRGALQEIARLGGGLVESFPEDVTDRRTSGGFLHNATTSLFERQGFTRDRQLGTHHWLMTKDVRKTR